MILVWGLGWQGRSIYQWPNIAAAAGGGGGGPVLKGDWLIRARRRGRR